MGMVEMTKKIIEFIDKVMRRIGEIDEYKGKVYSKQKKIKGLPEKAIVIFVKRKKLRLKLKVLIMTPTNFEEGTAMASAGTPEEIERIIQDTYREIKKGILTFHSFDDKKEEEKVVFHGDLDYS
jgi:hypothetical protein